MEVCWINDIIFGWQSIFFYLNVILNVDIVCGRHIQQITTVEKSMLHLSVVFISPWYVFPVNVGRTAIICGVMVLITLPLFCSDQQREYIVIEVYPAIPLSFNSFWDPYLGEINSLCEIYVNRTYLIESHQNIFIYPWNQILVKNYEFGLKRSDSYIRLFGEMFNYVWKGKAYLSLSFKSEKIVESSKSKCVVLWVSDWSICGKFEYKVCCVVSIWLIHQWQVWI